MSVRRAVGLAGALALGVVLTADVARGEERSEPVRVAVVPVLVARDGGVSGRAIGDAAEAAVRRRLELAVLSEEERFAVSGAGLSEQVLECGADAPCVADAIQRLGAPLGLVVVVNLELAPPLIGVQLVDCGARRVVAESIGAAAEDAADLAPLVERRADEVLTRAGRPARGRLVVHLRPPDAVLTVGAVGADPRVEPGAAREGEARGVVSYVLEPGAWRVRAEAPGHAAGEREVVLGGGAVRELDLELSAESSPLGWAWLWIALGAAAAAGGAAAWLYGGRTTERYACVRVPGADCGP